MSDATIIKVVSIVAIALVFIVSDIVWYMTLKNNKKELDDE